MDLKITLTLAMLFYNKILILCQVPIMHHPQHLTINGKSCLTFRINPSCSSTDSKSSPISEDDTASADNDATTMSNVNSDANDGADVKASTETTEASPNTDASIDAVDGNLPPPPTSSTTPKKRACKHIRKRRAHTMPDIMMTPRARTISEQSEEYDKVLK